LSASGEIVAGPCADVILARAEELDADMIVVGSHGFGAVLRVLLGSVSAEILKKARCPVVVVPTRKSG
jgi:nucleotide-binding universal stress UspA family protein